MFVLFNFIFIFLASTAAHAQTIPTSVGIVGAFAKSGYTRTVVLTQVQANLYLESGLAQGGIYFGEGSLSNASLRASSTFNSSLIINRSLDGRITVSLNNFLGSYYDNINNTRTNVLGAIVIEQDPITLKVTIRGVLTDVRNGTVLKEIDLAVSRKRPLLFDVS